MIAIVTYQYPCFYARCFVFKYESSGKVKKIEIEHNANSGSINWVAVGLAKKYILFYDADWVVQYNRTTLKKDTEYKVTAENNPYGAYLDSKGYNDGFSKAQTVN